MIDLLALPLPEWVALVPFALALGLVLYLSLLGLAIFPLVPLAPSLPGDLEFLSTPLVIGPAAALYLAGWVVRRRRIPELFWEGGNIGVRFVAASLLTVLALPNADPALQAVAGIATGLAAAILQFLRLGWITLDHQGGLVPARRWIQKLGVDTVALGLLWLTLFTPATASILAGVVFLALAAGARPAVAAGRLSLVALAGLFRTAAGRAGWRSATSPPRALERRAGASDSESAGGVRWTAAAILQHGGQETFRDGWLVAGAGPPRFIPRSRNPGPGVPLGFRRPGSYVRRHVFTEVELAGDAGDMLLMVPAGGPGPDLLGPLLTAPEKTFDSGIACL